MWCVIPVCKFHVKDRSNHLPLPPPHPIPSQLFAVSNSGTYNSEWMVIDPPNRKLWVLDQVRPSFGQLV